LKATQFKLEEQTEKIDWMPKLFDILILNILLDKTPFNGGYRMLVF
jgi:hypothetical protein